MKFTQDDEAIEIANSTDYGLVSGVFTADLDRANRAAQKLRAGQVFVNEWYAGGVETPLAVMENQDTDVKKGARRCGTMSKRKTSR